MTPEQFAAIAALSKMRKSPSQEAARLVLVDGMSVIAAAQAVGISQPGANQAVLRCRRAMDLAKIAMNTPCRVCR